MSDQLRIGDQVVDLQTGTVSTGHQLKPLELSLLRYLADRAGQAIGQGRLLQEVWGYTAGVRSRAPHIAMIRLRAALEPDPQAPRFLLSVPGEAFRLQGSERITAPPPRPVARFPAIDTSYVGRGALLASIQGADDPLITLVGPAGIGKTRLALEVARRSAPPGGVWFCDLHAATTLEDARGRLAVALAPAGGGDLERLDLADRLNRLGAALLVLDNLEQIPDRAALVAGCLSALEIRILATSRSAVGLASERVVQVGPLDPGDAASLLRQRVEHRGVGLEAVHEGQLLDYACGMPLTLEIVAANVALVGAEAVVWRLQSGARLRSRTHPSARHDTVDAAVAWSLELLPDPLVRKIGQLAILDGPFGLPVAEAILGESVFDTLTELVDAALLTVERDRVGTRFRILVPIRDAVRRRDEVEATEVQDRLMEWIDATVLDELSRTLQQWRPVVVLPMAVSDHHALFAATQGSSLDDDRRCRVILGLAISVAYLGDIEAAIDWIGRALALDPTGVLEADLRHERAHLLPSLAAIEEFHRAVAAAGRAGNVDRQLVISIVLGMKLARYAPEQVPPWLAELEAMSVSEAGGRLARSGAAYIQTILPSALGDPVGGEAAVRGALQHLEAGDPSGFLATRIQVRLASLISDQGKLGEARALFESAIETSTAPGLRGIALVDLAEVQLGLGRAHEAMVSLRRAMVELYGTSHAYPSRLMEAAWLAAAAGDAEQSAAWLEEHLTLPVVSPTDRISRDVNRSLLEVLAHGPALGLPWAEQAWAAAVANDPNWIPSTAMWLAELRVAAGDLAGALSVLSGSVGGGGRIDTESPLLQAELLLRLGDLRGAVRCTEPLRSTPVRPVAKARAHGIVAMAGALRDQDDLVQAALTQMAGIEGHNSGWLALQRAVVAIVQGRPPPPDPIAVAPVQVALGWCVAELQGRPEWLNLDPPEARPRVAADGSWFEVSGQPRVDLSRRPVVQRFLAQLAEARGPISVQALIRKTWPGERPRQDSGRARVYVMVSTLRKLGLADAILTETRDGQVRYTLDADVVSVPPGG